MNEILEKYKEHRDVFYDGLSGWLIHKPSLFDDLTEEDLIEILQAKANDIKPLSRMLIVAMDGYNNHSNHFEVALFIHKREWFYKYKLFIDERIMWAIDELIKKMEKTK